MEVLARLLAYGTHRDSSIALTPGELFNRIHKPGDPVYAMRANLNITPNS